MRELSPRKLKGFVQQKLQSQDFNPAWTEKLSSYPFCYDCSVQQFRGVLGNGGGVGRSGAQSGNEME